MKPFAALLLVPALALPAPWGMHERTETRREPLAAGSTLSIRSTHGDIKITPWDKEEVDLVANIKEREKGSVTFSVQRTKSGLEIEAQLPERGIMQWGESDGISFTLKVPRRVACALTIGHGGIEISGLEGSQELATRHGGITIEDCKGDVNARTSHGAVSVNRLMGDLKGRASHGSLNIKQASGGIDFAASHGAIHAEGLDGRGKGITLAASHGSIQLALGNATGEVDAHASHGSVEVERQGAGIVESRKSSSVRLRIPGSAQAIRLRTDHGSITIR